MKNLSSPLENTEEDHILDTTLMPKKWEDYIGQEKVRNTIKVIIDASKKRKDPCCEHILLSGGSGLGKTTLARLIAKEMNREIKISSGPAIEKAGDLAAILTNLSDGEVFFIDEIHRLNRNCEETIYPVLDNYKLDLILGRGPMARTMELKVPFFTLIGATTMPSLLSSPLRNRFGAILRLDFYTEKEIEKIIKRSSLLLNIKINQDAIQEIAKRSRFTPRVANRILKRVRDYAQVKNRDIIDKSFSIEALDFLEIDKLGLESGDRKLLEIIINKFNGGPVGLQALSSALGEEEKTILEMYEPYLIRVNLIERTPKGRTTTDKAYRHIKNR
jgi:holliday junction DNA helicase RuvB